MPAERVGLPDRGVLAPGAWADITIFDPDDGRRARHSRPSRTPSRSGSAQVFVNGRPAFDDGAFADADGPARSCAAGPKRGMTPKGDPR